MLKIDLWRVKHNGWKAVSRFILIRLMPVPFGRRTKTFPVWFWILIFLSWSFTPGFIPHFLFLFPMSRPLRHSTSQLKIVILNPLCFFCFKQRSYQKKDYWRSVILEVVWFCIIVMILMDSGYCGCVKRDPC